MISERKLKEYLKETQIQANLYSGCRKVQVGSLLIPHNTKTFIYGANRAIPDICKSKNGQCHRIELYGDDFKEHRLPSDCRAIHSEIDAITQAAKYGIPTQNATLIVTRYPCEACARAIVSAGIKYVYYGREQEISDETARIFQSGHVYVKHISDWTYEDTRR